MIWSRVTGHPQELEDVHRLGGQPGGLLDGRRSEDQGGEGGDGDRQADGGHHFDEGRGQPQVTEEDEVEQHPQGRPGDHDGHDGRRPDAPALLGVEVVVEAGDEEGQRSEGEVEDSRRGVGDDQAGRRDGVDATEHQSGDHELQHPVLPLLGTRSSSGNGSRRRAPPWERPFQGIPYISIREPACWLGGTYFLVSSTILTTASRWASVVSRSPAAFRDAILRASSGTLPPDRDAPLGSSAAGRRYPAARSRNFWMGTRQRGPVGRVTRPTS